MEAIRIHETGGNDILRFETLPDPVCEENEILVDIKSISVNFSDTLIRRGLYPYMPDFPAILGNESAGIIHSLGSAVQHLNPGQKVIVFGVPSYCSRLAVSAKRIIPIPEEIDLDEAAALPIIYLTAFHMMHTVRHIQAGETILTYAAAGGVGTAVIQLAQITGARVIGLTSTAEKAKFISNMGCDHVINYKQENVVERVLEMTNGQGVDLILDSVAGAGFADNFKMMNTFGHLIWFGIAAGQPTTNLLSAIGDNPAKCHAVSMFHLYGVLNNPEMMKSSIKTLIGYLASGRIKPVIHERIPLNEAGRAHEILEHHRNIGKVILYP